MSLKEIYEEIDQWVKMQDPLKIKAIRENRIHTSDKIHYTLSWYYTILDKNSNNRDYIFNVKTATIEDISKYMLEYIGDYGPEDGEDEDDFNEDQMSTGYATTWIYNKIKKFWENLDKDKIMSIAEGRCTDDYEIELDGHRSYFLSRSEVFPQIFNYIYYTLKIDYKQFDDNIYNSEYTVDAIEKYYPNGVDIKVLTELNVDQLYLSIEYENHAEDKITFNHMIDNIINRFNKNSKFSDILKSLEDLKMQ